MCIGNLSFTWRHDVPDKNFKLVGHRVINFLIVRDLDDWLISMYNTPYYLSWSNTKSFGEFLIAKQKLSGKGDVPIKYDNNRLINYTVENKTIFQIRYDKLNAFLDFFRKNENVVFVSLKYIQNEENCIHFMKEVSTKYGLDISEFHGCINIHTKTHERNIKNRTYETKIGSIDRAIINTLKNKELEEWVENLTFELK